MTARKRRSGGRRQLRLAAACPWIKTSPAKGRDAPPASKKKMKEWMIGSGKQRGRWREEQNQNERLEKRRKEGRKGGEAGRSHAVGLVSRKKVTVASLALPNHEGLRWGKPCIQPKASRSATRQAADGRIGQWQHIAAHHIALLSMVGGRVCALSG